MKTEQLLGRMMAFKPVTEEIERVNALVDFLAGYLRAGGLRVRIEKYGKRKILYAGTRPGRTPAVLMNAHLDVIPAPDSLFKLRRSGQWLMGRGTNDCLGNCAVIANALISVGAAADAGAVFSTDEETGGMTTARMVELGYCGRHIILVMDGSGYAVVTAQKGILAVCMRASGKACHSSTPWQGENAFDRLVDAYLRVRNAFPAVRAGDEWHTTMSANVIRAGTVFNRVPDTAEMLLDIRYTEAERPADLMKKLRKLSGSGLTIEIVKESPLMLCDEQAPALQEFHTYMQRRLRRKIAWKRLNGATDARHFSACKIPIAIIGVPGSGVHALTERVSGDGLRRYEDMLRGYLMEG
ncbi:MAG: M20 family metallopeptidase [Kiritimatiellia bacterium]|jgi:succinyl-diaminopimelate desuccinylase